MSDRVNKTCHKIIGYLVPPYMYRKNNELHGIMYNVINVMAKKYNLCVIYDTSEVNRKYASYIPENDSYVGMVTNLIYKDHEIFPFPLTLSGHEKKFFDVSDSVDTEVSNIVYKYPSVEPDPLGFLKPFNSLVWLFLFLSFLGISLFLFFTSFSNTKYGNTKFNDKRFTKYLFNSCIIPWKITLSQATSISEKPFQNLLIGFWLVASLLISLTYKSNLKAALILPKVYIPFRSIEELVKQDKMTWVLADGAGLQAAGKASEKGTLLRELYDDASYFVTSFGQADKDIVSGKVALPILQTAAFGYLANKYDEDKYCSVTVAEKSFLPRSYSLLLRKGSPLTPKLNNMYEISLFCLLHHVTWHNYSNTPDRLRKLTEAGLIQHWKKIEFYKGLRCTGRIGNDEKIKLRPLGLKDLEWIFFILLAGLVLAFLSFLLEVILGRLN